MFYKCTGSVIHAMWLAEPLAFQIDKTIEKRATNEPHFKSNRPPTYVEGRLKWCWEESNCRHKDFQSFALPSELQHRCNRGIQM